MQASYELVDHLEAITGKSDQLGYPLAVNADKMRRRHASG